MARPISRRHTPYVRRNAPYNPQSYNNYNSSYSYGDDPSSYRSYHSFQPRNMTSRSRHVAPRNVMHWRDSNDYRNEYFRKNKGVCGLYFCSLCFRAMTRNDHRLEVDHIYPPSRLSRRNSTGTRNTSFFARRFNSTWNCTTICRDCNRKKGNNVGFVTFRGVAFKVAGVARMGVGFVARHAFRGAWNFGLLGGLKSLGWVASKVTRRQRFSLFGRKRFRGGRSFGR